MTIHRSASRVLLGLLALALSVASAIPAGAQAAGGTAAKCVDGKAGDYPCKNIDLLSQVQLTAAEGGGVSDVWGWVDPETKKEYAVLGTSGGVSFFDISEPAKPVFVGRMVGKPDMALPWIELEILNDHVYAVCDLSPCGLQVFDLTRLRGVESALPVWRPDVVLPIGTAHSIASNPETNHIFVNGTALVAGPTLIFDVSVPLAPRPVGGMGDDGYSHDSLCTNYKGPDKAHKGNEICFQFNEDTVTIYDVTANPTMPEQLARETYDTASYVHSGALTKDQSYLISTDEGDETGNGTPSTLYIWDIRKLSAPKMIDTFVAPSASIDHNVYSEQDALYHANYVNGFRILDMKDTAKGKLKEVAWFDTVPTSDAAEFNGVWAAYPYLPSGNVIVGDMNGAMFIVRPNDSVYKSLGVKRK